MMAVPTDVSDGPININTNTTHDEQKNTPTKKATKNAAAGAHQKKSTARKGANGVLLKKFESVMCDMFATTPASANNEVSQEALHHLTPRYSKLPPFMNDMEQQELIENAKIHWTNNSRLVPINDTPDIVVSGHSSPWPFDSRTPLPQCGCVRGNASENKTRKTKTGKDTGGVGDVHNNERAWRKEMQLANMIQCVLALLPDDVRHPEANNNASRTFRIIDFAGGTGHLAVPLALLLPHCEVICLDLKKWSLDLMHRRVDGSLDDNDKKTHDNSHKLPCQSNSVQVSKTIPNLSTYYGSIQTYPHAFDIGVSLHACGEASDWVLRKCLQQKACWVVCSCCCGKLRREALNPYVFQSTGGNEKGIHYPQSKAFASLGRHYNTNTFDDGSNNGLDVTVARKWSNGQQLMSADMFDELSRAADYSELGDVRKHRNACRRAAKSLVEMDRLLFAKECMMCADSSGNDGRNYESNTVMTRMVPWEASPKNDVLIGWFQDSYNPYRQHMASTSGQMLATTAPQEDTTCDADFQVALHHLFGKNTSEKNQVNANNGTKELKREDNDQNDWTASEETDIKYQIEQFLLGSESLNDGEENYSKILKFPTGMGPRKRKMTHYIAESMGLRHWGEGKKESEKIVAVALRRK